MAHVIDAVLQLRDQFSGQLKHVTQNLSTFQKQTKYVAQDIKNVSKTSEKLGGTLTKSITVPLLGIGGVATKIGMEFEKSMSNVSALSGATGNDLKELEKKAREMGAKTSKTAKDAADAMGYMALAGWKQKQIISGIEPVLRLAEAGNLDLAKASSLTTDSLSAMGLTVKDLPHYLDVVAQSARSSNTDIDQMMEAYIGVGGVMKGLNVPLEESAIAIDILANKGIKGNESATALSAVVNNLTAPVGRAKDALDAIKFSAFDSKGKFKGLTNVLIDLKNKTRNMNDEQRNAILSAIGGKEHIKDLNALLNGLGTDYAKLKNDVKNANGALNDMATTMQDNNAGSITQLTSALEELGLKIYDVLRPSIATVTKNVQNFVDKLNKLTPAQQQSIVNFAKWAIIIGPTILGISKLGKMTSSTITSINKFSRSIKKAGGMLNYLSSPGHKFMTIMYAIALVAILVITHWDKVKECFNKISKSISNATGMNEKSVGKFLIGTVAGLTTLLSVGSIFTKGFGGGFKLLGKIIKGSGKGVTGTLKLLLKGFRGLSKGASIALKAVLRITSAVGKGIGKGLLGLLRIGKLVGKGMISVISKVTAVMLANPIIIIIVAIIGVCILLYEAWKHNWGGIRDKTKAVIEFCKTKIESIKETFNTVKEKCKEFKEKICEYWGNIETFLAHPIQGTVSLIKNGDLSGIKGKNALGTPYWGGGLSVVGEHGPEVVEMPAGSKVHDNKDSRRMAGRSGNISVNFTGDIHVRQESDIDAIANAIVKKLQIQRLNMA